MAVEGSFLFKKRFDRIKRPSMDIQTAELFNFRNMLASAIAFMEVKRKVRILLMVSNHNGITGYFC
jgi:hypothetical protein